MEQPPPPHPICYNSPSRVLLCSHLYDVHTDGGSDIHMPLVKHFGLVVMTRGMDGGEIVDHRHTTTIEILVPRKRAVSPLIQRRFLNYVGLTASNVKDYVL